ncbi:hypothetical protein R1sor_011339 [Riccia sorocarpa]|uniref:Uncharacterized protein n=1 Tax=Riccia sorocarpa TaxID=122646 RepID=A0ABD3I0N2_9MARC
MTNTPAEEFEAIQHTFPSIFCQFQQIFTSSATGMRKPNLNFFKHVLAKSGVEPSETVFLDDDLANVTAAESVGITSILVPSPRDAAALAQTVNQLVSTLHPREEQLSVARDSAFVTCDAGYDPARRARTPTNSTVLGAGGGPSRGHPEFESSAREAGNVAREKNCNLVVPAARGELQIARRISET